MSTQTVIAIAAHPDDIEFNMAGTLLRLRQAGWAVHCFNVASGNLGSQVASGRQSAAIRRREAREAARRLGAVWHPPIRHDLEIFYDDRTLREVAAVIREVKPDVVLTHSPQDYMEDHTNTCRLAVSATFARGFRNYRTRPPRPPVGQETVLYHAMPHLNLDPLGQRVTPELYIDITSVMEEKRRLLAAHRSQKEWLDTTQGMDSYLDTMVDLAGQLGRDSRIFTYAEGWRRHLHAGFGAAEADPLRTALKPHSLRNARYRS